MISVLITGFGPFPGAPFNPTGAVAATLARWRRPALHDVRLAAHVFRTSYAAVDRDLPTLLARHKPDVLLMFGLAARTKHVRIETRARNVVATFPDAAKLRPHGRSIVPGARDRAMRIPAQRLLVTARPARVPVKLSRDAGSYLCNYLCWRALEASGKPNGPAIAVFVHVPKLSVTPRRRGATPRIGMNDLVRLGRIILLSLVAAARPRSRGQR